jgi:DNA-binding phage protein
MRTRFGALLASAVKRATLTVFTTPEFGFGMHMVSSEAARIAFEPRDRNSGELRLIAVERILKCFKITIAVGSGGARHTPVPYLFEASENVVDYGKGQFAVRDNMAALRKARREFTVTAIAHASGLSRRELTRILAGTVKPTKRTWAMLARGIAILRRGS